MGTLVEVFGLLASGAGGGLLGGIFGLFKKHQEASLAVKLRALELDQAREDNKEAAREREHTLMLIEKQGDVSLAETEAEVQGQIDVAHSKALAVAQDKEFGGLKTSRKMDNYRASVRPTLAYWYSFVFSVFGGWAFSEFHTVLAPHAQTIMMGFIGTLTFLVSSMGTFYFVSRDNARV